jgi:hypothetical protein
MDGTVERTPRRSLMATTLVRGPLIGVFACLVLPMVVPLLMAGPLAVLAGIPLTPAITIVHATERGESRGRMLALAALSTLTALVLFLAFWVAFFGLVGDMSGFD